VASVTGSSGPCAAGLTRVALAAIRALPRQSGYGIVPGLKLRWPPRALAVAERAHGGRPAGSEPALEVRASPEMRPGSHDWAATPQASLSHR
jgi:hypothetical protein